MRNAVHPTTLNPRPRAGSWSFARCQLRQSTAQTSALPSATATIEARCAAVSMRSEKIERLSAGGLQVAGERDDARHGIRAVVGEALVAEEVEREDGATVGRRPDRCRRTAPHQHRAGIELALPAFDAVIARLADDARRAASSPSSIGPQQVWAKSSAGCLHSVGKSSSSGGSVAGSGAITPPPPSRMPPGTAGSSALRRTIFSGASMPAARRRRAGPPTPRRCRRGPRASHTWEGRRWSSRHLRKLDREKRKPADDQRRDHSFGGSAGTGTVPRPDTFCALTRRRKARPAPARGAAPDAPRAPSA